MHGRPLLDGCCGAPAAGPAGSPAGLRRILGASPDTDAGLERPVEDLGLRQRLPEVALEGEGTRAAAADGYALTMAQMWIDNKICTRHGKAAGW